MWLCVSTSSRLFGVPYRICSSVFPSLPALSHALACAFCMHWLSVSVLCIHGSVSRCELRLNTPPLPRPFLTVQSPNTAGRQRAKNRACFSISGFTLLVGCACPVTTMQPEASFSLPTAEASGASSREGREGQVALKPQGDASLFSVQRGRATGPPKSQ